MVSTNAYKMLLNIAVIVAVITSQCLSAHALRCHQCNSHKEEDCINLKLTTPGDKRDDQFLKECVMENGKEPFCRKTVLKVEVTREQRIIRECGYMREKMQTDTGLSCVSADNEGYQQTICACDEDGCNGSQSIANSKWTILGVTGLSAVLATVLHRN
ncbi:uncharacterized protein LOC106088072 isoform X2 [Stomoxys calcitrans]|uniref:Uncharacterized protein n=1 Tax=Stomoxys calcitrans TaxID=35570 RepID=A0A1I8P3I6_STOCA|nr:uncharacterized protein LOC106088072 isoform X2 [Stomoxys calcitrans]